MTIEIVDFPIENGGSFHSFFVRLPGRVMFDGYVTLLITFLLDITVIVLLL